MSTVTAVPLHPVKRGYLVWLWLGLAIACISAYALARQGDPALLREERGLAVKTTPSGLKYKILKPGGPGAHPSDSDVALVQYKGRLLDGTIFDKSQQPTPMPVSGVVPGFSEALKLMGKGARYRVWIPSALGYGDRASGPIPANSTLVFDVDLVDFLPESVVRQMQAQAQAQAQQSAAPSGLPVTPR